MVNGSYLVARKIRMEIESWDTDPLTDQERIFARHKVSGAPVTGGEEFTPIDYTKTTDTGELAVDVNAHVRLASPEQNGGIRLLRRGYNYTDGQDPDTGKLAAGLFFIAFQRDPQAQFKVIQTRLGQVRPAQRVHRAHRRRAVGLPARGQRPGRLVREGPVRLKPAPVRRQAPASTAVLVQAGRLVLVPRPQLGSRVQLSQRTTDQPHVAERVDDAAVTLAVVTIGHREDHRRTVLHRRVNGGVDRRRRRHPQAEQHRCAAQADRVVVVPVGVLEVEAGPTDGQLGVDRGAGVIGETDQFGRTQRSGVERRWPRAASATIRRGRSAALSELRSSWAPSWTTPGSGAIADYGLGMMIQASR